MTSANRAILVVEDELLLRLVAVDIVEDAGFEALAAATADEALAILEARADDVPPLVFTDIQMPGSMDGPRAGARGARPLASRRTRRDVRPVLDRRTTCRTADGSLPSPMTSTLYRRSSR